MVDIDLIYSDLLDMADAYYHQHDYLDDAFMVETFQANMMA